MKLRNKKTGEIVEDTDILGLLANNCSKYDVPLYRSLAELNEEWEDYEEPKKYWYVYGEGVLSAEDDNDFGANTLKAVGNYFEAREEAEEAVEKLKAWKRLKDKGFKFVGWDSLVGGSPHLDCCGIVHIRAQVDEYSEPDKYLDLLFGGEE